VIYNIAVQQFGGTGYPQGLRGEEINLHSRIVTLVDVLDALGTKRVYKDPWARDRIFDYIRAEKGKKFDPQIVDLFLQCRQEISQIQEQYVDPLR